MGADFGRVAMKFCGGLTHLKKKPRSSGGLKALVGVWVMKIPRRASHPSRMHSYIPQLKSKGMKPKAPIDQRAAYIHAVSTIPWPSSQYELFRYY